MISRLKIHRGGNAARVLAVLLISFTCFRILFFSHNIQAQANSTPLAFTGATLISGTNGAVNAVYRFPNVTDGVDARVTLSAISNGASMTEIDIPASNTGYEPAFQPYVTIANGTSGSPKTSYIEWQIRFKKAGTADDTTLAAVSATAIDVDGSTNLQERVQAYTPTSYSVNSPNDLTVTTDGSSVIALSPNTIYPGIDSSIKQVMFQMNFENVNLITYRTGGINRSSSAPRQFSIYFKAFFEEYTPLPVDLLFFNASPGTNGEAMLGWATAAEKNNAYFAIERSRDGIQYAEIGIVEGIGNSTLNSYYSYIDPDPMTGKNFYRLVQYDFDGKYRVYDPVRIDFKRKKENLTIENVFPNPVSYAAMVTMSVPSNEVIRLTLLNANGREERQLALESISSSGTWNVNGLEDLESGVYFLQASQNGEISKTFRILKN